jgi:hypothetical protein
LAGPYPNIRVVPTGAAAYDATVLCWMVTSNAPFPSWNMIPVPA